MIESRDPQGNRTKRSFRFVKTLGIALSLVVACWVFLYAFYGHYSEADKLAYDKMVKGEKEESELKEPKISRQKRLGLEKSVFFYNHSQRHELKISSRTSELALEKIGRHVEIVEHLQDVTSLLQESVYYVLPDGSQALLQADGRLLAKGADPSDPLSWTTINAPGVIPQQIILLLKAGNATYHYKSELFSAENVQLLRFLVSNHDLATADLTDSSLISEGSAARVTFSMAGKNLDFEAEDFKGAFVLNRSGLQEGRISVSADQMTYQTDLVTLNGHAVVNFKATTLFANLIILQLAEENVHGKTEKKVIKTITANGDVQLCGEDFTAASDHALFQRDPKATEGVLPGTITLTCYSPEYLCRLTSSEGDTILSKEIVVDTIQREVLFAYPRGTLNGGTFSANKMVWNEPTSSVILFGDVEIMLETPLEDDKTMSSGQSIGKLETANEVRLVLSTIEGKKVLRGIQTDGNATLTYIDPETRSDHVLKSYGSLHIDHLKMEAKLQSPKNSDGSVMEGYQIFFEDDKGQIRSDKVFVKYGYVDKKMIPMRIVLQGNVKIENNLEHSETDKTKSDQYILSDRVDFIPLTKEMIFKAAKGKRVLLFDKENHLEVSAPGMKLIRDKAARKDTIQGLGDVRFNFVESELEQFRRNFSFEKKTSEALKK